MADKTRKESIKAYKDQKTYGGIYKITDRTTGQILLETSMNLHGSESLFQFSKSMGGCVHKKLEKVWENYKKDDFSFEVVETLELKETQTRKEFIEELELLKELWLQKMDDVLFFE